LKIAEDLRLQKLKEAEIINETMRLEKVKNEMIG
jgi:hypothetical protein